MKRCTSHGRRVCVWCAVSYPTFLLEHWVAEKLWPFTIVTRLLGL